MTGPRFTPLVNSLPATVPFVGPESQERARGQGFAARLGANESVYGPPPQALQAMQNAAADSWKYGDPECFDLRNALAAHHSVGMENILVGGGIDGLLGVLTRMLIAPGDPVVTSAGAYPTLNYHVNGYGGVLHQVPFAGDHEDPAALIKKATEVGAKMIYLSNPNNPMGSWHSAEKVQAMIDAVPDGSLLILDEAYIELAPDGTAPAIDPSDARVIRMRTFSKAYGLAGLRVGYAIGSPALISSFNKVRDHFGVSGIGQAAAIAAIGAQDWLPHLMGDIVSARAQLSEIAVQNGLTPLPSATNFVTMDCGADGDFARAVLAALIDENIFVRMPFVPPQDRCIRVSCAPQDMLDKFAKALPRALAKARG